MIQWRQIDVPISPTPLLMNPSINPLEVVSLTVSHITSTLRSASRSRGRITLNLGLVDIPRSEIRVAEKGRKMLLNSD